MRKRQGEGEAACGIKNTVFQQASVNCAYADFASDTLAVLSTRSGERERYPIQLWTLSLARNAGILAAETPTTIA
jgi:hypothetical protein